MSEQKHLCSVSRETTPDCSLDDISNFNDEDDQEEYIEDLCEPGFNENKNEHDYTETND